MDRTQPGRDEWERPGEAVEDEGETEANERLRTLNRYQLAAALIEYDDDDERDQPSFRAHQSAVLSPFRHILAPAPAAAAHEPTPARERDAVRPGEYAGRSEAGAGRVSSSDGGRGSVRLPGGDGRGRESLDVVRSSFGDDLHRRYSRSQLGALDDLDSDDEERLAGEWGLTDIMSSLGSPTRTSSAFEIVPRAGEGESDHRETRSEPDVARDRESTNFTLPSATAVEASHDKAAPGSHTRLRILERPSYRNRTQSALELPTFDELPSFDFAADDLTSVLQRPSVARRRSSFSFSGMRSDDGQSSRRPSLSLSRPLSRMSRAGSADLNRDGGESPVSGGFEREPRPSMSMSARPMSTFSTTPSVFTSRFDPTMLALAKAELEKDRPVFANKDAGAPPRIVLMPAPLAGRPLLLPKPPRVEGPEPDSEPDEVPEPNEGDPDAVGKPTRAPGALYGRSLMDVLDERAALAKARQRQFIPGQDGRRSMMDWGKPRDGTVTPPADPDAEAALHESPDTPKAVPRSKSHMSIFGPDHIYQRDAARRLELDRIEAEEREAEEKREAAVWEKERLKSEKKKLKKTKNSERLAAEQKLEGRSPSRIGGNAPAPNLPPSSRRPNAPPLTPPRDRRPSIAPSLSLPTALSPHDGSSWFAPPSPRTPSSEASEEHRYAPAPQRPRSPESPTLDRSPLRSATSAERAYALRTSVMLGKMTPKACLIHDIVHDATGLTRLLLQQAAAERGRFGLRDDNEDDERPLGERLSNAFELKSAPKLHVDLSMDGFNLSPGERAELTGLEGSSRPPSDDSDSDDVPLGLRKVSLQPAPADESEDDDVPLGLRHGPTFVDGDEDDRPLGLAVPGLQQPFYAQAQAQAQQQQAQQWMQYQHQSTLLAMQSQQALNVSYGAGTWGGSTSAGAGGGNAMMGYPYGQTDLQGSMVEKWRRGVSLEQ